VSFSSLPLCSGFFSNSSKIWKPVLTKIHYSPFTAEIYAQKAAKEAKQGKGKSTAIEGRTRELRSRKKA
jgi:hypothetical protein